MRTLTLDNAVSVESMYQGVMFFHGSFRIHPYTDGHYEAQCDCGTWYCPIGGAGVNCPNDGQWYPGHPSGYNKNEYVTGVGRSPEEMKRVTHLYKGDFEDPGLPMCLRGWNRDDHASYSIWRNNISEKGMCKVCERRANKGLPGVPSPIKE